MKDERILEMKVFKAVIDLGGFTAAAHHFSVSQPYISKIINNLEKRLGITLIHRTTRSQKVTPEGEAFIKLAEEILGKLDSVEQWAYDTKSQGMPAGELRVTAPIAFGIDQVSSLIPTFLDKYPNIGINLSLTDSIESLVDGSADVAIRMGKLPDSSLISKKLCDLNRIVVVGKGYIDKNGEPEAPEELIEHNCLMWSGGREHLNKWPFYTKGVHRHITVRGNIKSSNGLALVSMCYQGLGIMRMAEHIALPAVKKGLVVELFKDTHIKKDSGIYAVFNPERKLTPRIRVFVDYMHEHLKTNPWETVDI